MKRRHHITALLTLAFLFAASRLWAYGEGVRFQAGEFPIFMHFLDPMLLEHDLLESSLYLHMNPPLFNLFLGGFLKLFGAASFQVIQICYLLVSFAAGFLLYILIAALTSSAALSFLGASFFVLSPASVLWENRIFYTTPLAFLLVLSAVLLRGALHTDRGSRWLAFFTCIAVLCGIAAMFNLVYVLLVIAVLWLGFGRSRAMLWGALPCILFVGLLHCKNLLLFDIYSTSSWLGCNLSRVVLHQLQPSEKVLPGGEAVLPLPAFDQEMKVVEPAYSSECPYPEIAALCSRTKSTGQPNLNHYSMIPLCAAYLRQSLSVILNSPEVYMRGLSTAWRLYFAPAHKYPYFSQDQLIGAATSFFDRFILLTTAGGLSLTALLLFILTVASIPLSLFIAERKMRALLLFIGVTVLYVAAVGNALEVGENNRFRFTTDPLSTAAGLYAVARLIRLSKSRHEPKSRQPT
ncbi:MAG: glycosyltransferase family 39 protein [Deltaproteobacteria bacterium]|nr:glycosyltransferase family 39 protein [Deltaproteobacteria bacterium]